MLSNNKLQAEDLKFPQFNKISLVDLEKNINQQIIEYNKLLTDLTVATKLEVSWDHLMQPLEDSGAKLDALVNIAHHLNSVKDSIETRDIYTNIITKLTKFSSDFLQNKQLYKKILELSKTKNFNDLNFAQQKIIKDLLLNFKLAGVDLPIEQQNKYKAITEELSKLSDQFSKNVLDATQSWNYYISLEDKDKLLGLPDHYLHLANQAAIKQGKKSGWLLTLDAPSVDIVLKYASNRELREIIYKAYVTKASDQASIQDIKFDNTKIIERIIELRHELAAILGFKNYSEYSLVHKMAKTTSEVQNFLEALAIKSLPIAKQEFKALEKHAEQKDKLTKLQPWDLNYYAESYKEKLFNLSTEELRNYFSLNHVINGMFKLANGLYGIKVQEVVNFDSWDPSVKLYKVTNNSGDTAGYFYMDLYVREHKQSGAWMGSCLSRHKWIDGKLQHPIAFLVTNFIKPINNAEEPLLYHNDVVTLLHEFGHVLHHILTKVDYISASGCNGVEWDAVELPSQFMEKWAYDWDFLQTVALHKKSGKKLTKKQFDSLIGIKNYNSGISMIRQLEFGMFDFNLHSWVPNGNNLQPNVQKILDDIRNKIAVVPVAKFNRFQNSFSHIFAGGYAAGYYSYNWAEVLASDAFMFFHNSKHKSELGASFLKNILQQGGSRSAMELYIGFRGKKPKIDSLLEYRGLMK